MYTHQLMSIRLATLKGSGLFDSFVTAFSLGNPGVHTEIWIDGYRVSTFAEGATCVSVIPMGDICPSDWYVMEIPVRDLHTAISYVEQAVRSPATYRYYLPELAMPKALLDRVDTDLDCQRPATWDRLFCSQFALLFLRRCAMSGVLDVDERRLKLLWSINSRGCLPSRLKIIAERVFVR